MKYSQKPKPTTPNLFRFKWALISAAALIVAGSFATNRNLLDWFHLEKSLISIRPSNINTNLIYPTCSGSNPQNNGQISVTSAVNATHYTISSPNPINREFDGSPSLMDANTITTYPLIIATNIPNSGALYVVRFFNGNDTCYIDQEMGLSPRSCENDCPSLSGTYQDFRVNAANNKQIFTHDGGLITDAGGGGANYNNNQKDTVTVCAPVGQVNILVSLMNILANDTLKIYDGSSVSSPLLASFTNVSSITGIPQFESTNGCLTITFTSDGSGTSAGWRLEYSSGDIGIVNCFGKTIRIRSAFIKPNTAITLGDNFTANGNAPVCMVYFDENKNIIRNELVYCVDNPLNTASYGHDHYYGAICFNLDTIQPIDFGKLQTAQVLWLLDNSLSIGLDPTDPDDARTIQDGIWQLLGQLGLNCNIACQAARAAVQEVLPEPYIDLMGCNTSNINDTIQYTLRTNESKVRLSVSDNGALPSLCGTYPMGTYISGDTLFISGGDTQVVNLCLTRSIVTNLQFKVESFEGTNLSKLQIFTACDNTIQRFMSSQPIPFTYSEQCGVWSTFYSIGNLVWIDVNNNGLKDNSEAGIPNVKVILHYYNPSTMMCETIDSVLTDANGGYLFDTLSTGTYLIEIPPSNFAPGGPLAGYASSTGVNGSPTGPYENGPVMSDVDSIDSDDNGTALPIGGIWSDSIQLYGNEPVTDTAGKKDLSGALNSNSNLTIDFGFYPLHSIGNLVWIDANNNGKLNAGEKGIDSVKVILHYFNGTTCVAIDSQYTDANGGYLFDSLVAGKYLVEIAAINFTTGKRLNKYASSSGAGAVDPNTGPYEKAPDPDGNIDNDDNGTMNGNLMFPGAVFSDTLDLNGNEPVSPNDTTGKKDLSGAADIMSNLTVDFGFFPLHSLGNQLFVDANNDGKMQPTESPLPGVKMILHYVDTTGGGSVCVTVDSILTDVNGKYVFDSLIAGKYIVEVAKSNFAPGGVLAAYASSTGGGSNTKTGPYEVPGMPIDGDTPADSTDHGVAGTGTFLGSVIGDTVDIGSNEPLGEPNDTSKWHMYITG